jgi:hypothetical protein
VLHQEIIAVSLSIDQLMTPLNPYDDITNNEQVIIELLINADNTTYGTGNLICPAAPWIPLYRSDDRFAHDTQVSSGGKGAAPENKLRSL